MPAWLNLPNLLTLSRLALTPFVIAAPSMAARDGARAVRPGWVH
jgi:phosphatidylglycerophosphate synthase